ncbi:hypothetical protein BDR26DRAFT_404546 [Obelidium mucronatum]|nr:hypothetical protein BDR26DRAFT_404546 [Obelidium mucronatum]
MSISENSVSNFQPESIHSDNGGPELFKCPFPGCEKIFTQSYNVKPHHKLHFNIRPYLCKTCNLSFTRERDLVRHSGVVHENLKEVFCDHCTNTAAFALFEATQRTNLVNSRLI